MPNWASSSFSCTGQESTVGVKPYAPSAGRAPLSPDSAFHLSGSGSQAARYQIVVVASFTRTAH